MQVMITHGSLARTQFIQLSAWRLVSLTLLGLAGLALTVALAYHLLFMTAAREGWPVAGTMVRSLLQEQLAQRDRYVRENLDAMAHKVGELQARLLQLEAMGERVSGMAGIKPEETRPSAVRSSPPGGGRGGPWVPASLNLHELSTAVSSLDSSLSERADTFALIESRLFEKRLRATMVPSSPPVDGETSSGFGLRSDPFTGRSAFHAGLDFPAPVGTTVSSAAGGLVVVSETSPAYGHMLMVDHGNGLVTRYAHLARSMVKEGQFVKRGQKIAEVGSTGRSTGPHLHFEVLVEGVPQDPAKFLAGRLGAPSGAEHLATDAGNSRVAAKATSVRP